MKKFIVASKNKGKLNEIKEMLVDFPFEVISMEDAGIVEDIEESGETFEENAFIKAMEIFKITGEIVMADDSGLEVDYLNGAPGVYSSRYSGEGATDQDRNKKLLNALKSVPFEKRTARFTCAITIVFPDGKYFTIKECCEGHIAFESIGDKGFGYDPLFVPLDYDLTMAQLSSEEKNKISHRGKALKLMVDLMRGYI